MSDLDFTLSEQEYNQLTMRLIGSDPLFSKIVSQANKQLSAQREVPTKEDVDQRYRGNSHERIPPQS